jgi:hypothetical protein
MAAFLMVARNILKPGGFSLLPKCVIVNCLKGNSIISLATKDIGTNMATQQTKPICYNNKQHNAGIHILKSGGCQDVQGLRR